MSSVTPEHIQICSRHTPNQCKQLVKGYTNTILWPACLNGFIFFYGFYKDIIPNMIDNIESSEISENTRETYILDAVNLLSLQQQRWDHQIIATLGI